MFAIYATHARPMIRCRRWRLETARTRRERRLGASEDSHASLNRHDLFTLRGITAPGRVSFPMILGNDGVGTIGDGTRL
jgi:hypothetical protein